jgi:hypothetical protein
MGGQSALNRRAAGGDWWGPDRGLAPAQPRRTSRQSLYESLGVADRAGVIIAATNHEDEAARQSVVAIERIA